MKRILVVAIAAVFTVAFAVSAMAEVKISGEYRLRMEKVDNTNLTETDNGTSDDNSSQYGQRVRLSVVATPTDDTEIKVTLQATNVWGAYSTTGSYNENAVYDYTTGAYTYNGGPWLTGTWENYVDFHEAYLSIKNVFGTPISAKLGRQELTYGDQRLIGSFGWSNLGRSFDAWKLSYNSDVVDVDFVNSKLSDNSWAHNSWGSVRSKPGDSDSDKDLYVLYATLKSIPNNTLDLYYIWLRDGATGGVNQAVTANGNTIVGTVTNSELVTYGFRLNGKVEGLDYTLEMPFQTGEITKKSGTGANTKISASAMAAKVGYTLPGANKIRIGAEWDKATGDKNKTDNKIKTFTNLYPTNHDKYGFADQQGWRNMEAIGINVSGNINEKLNARVDYWMFSLDTPYDSWYGAGHWNNQLAVATSVRTFTGMNCGTAGTGKCKDDIGDEIDLTFNYKYNAAVGIQLALSRFMPGDAIKGRLEAINAGAAKEDSLDWYSLMITGKF